MGEVIARDTRLDRLVAIKVLNLQLVVSAELRARFGSEAVYLPKQVCNGPQYHKNYGHPEPNHEVDEVLFVDTTGGCSGPCAAPMASSPLWCCQLSSKFEEYWEARRAG